MFSFLHVAYQQEAVTLCNCITEYLLHYLFEGQCGIGRLSSIILSVSPSLRHLSGQVKKVFALRCGCIVYLTVYHLLFKILVIEYVRSLELQPNLMQPINCTALTHSPQPRDKPKRSCDSTITTLCSTDRTLTMGF